MPNSKKRKPILIFVSMAFVFVVCVLVLEAKSENASSVPKMYGMSINKAVQITEQQNLSIIAEDDEGSAGITAFDKVVVYETGADIPIPQLIGTSVDNLDSTLRQYDLTYTIED